MDRLRRKIIKAVLALATGGLSTTYSSCGGGDVEDTIYFAFRIVDVWV